MKKLLTLIYAAIFMCGSVAGYQNNTLETAKCDKSVNNCVSQCETAQNCFDGECTETENCENTASCFNGCGTDCQKTTTVTVGGCKNEDNCYEVYSRSDVCESNGNGVSRLEKNCREKECDTSSDCEANCSSEKTCNSVNSGALSGLIDRIREALNQNRSCGSATVNQPQTETSKPQVTENETGEATDEAGRVIELVNEERAAKGLKPLEYRADVQNAADIRANEIVTSFSHTRPDGSSCFTVLNQTGVTYRAVGENIAYGQRSAEEVMNGWMNSSGHRANILSENYTGIAVGIVQKGNVKYWVQIFIK